MTPITIQGLCKSFGKTIAVDSVDLEIKSGELFFLLGPSGCGKTTILRMIAGFTDPDAGVLKFGDRVVTHDPANHRNTGMVFQSYALWPHMTVRQNVAFGLDVRKIGREEKARSVDRALETVQMKTYADRKPNQLSGGQQQRVALARALVIEPTVLLLDEPLSNLDAKLRLQMRSQIRQICKAAGITAIYVTHDQKEALSMADRIAVLRAGRLVQVGPPQVLYERPTTRFVADFLGETNFVTAEVVRRESEVVILESPIGTLRSAIYPEDLPSTGNVTCSIRPEALQLAQPNGNPDIAAQGDVGQNIIEADRIEMVYLGETAQYQLRLGSSVTLKALELNPKPGDTPRDRIRAWIAPHDVVILSD